MARLQVARKRRGLLGGAAVINRAVGVAAGVAAAAWQGHASEGTIAACRAELATHAAVPAAVQRHHTVASRGGVP